MVSVTFVVTDDAIPANELENVVVRVFNEDGSTFVTQGTTDEDGELVLELDDATTYWVRFFKIGYAFDSKLTIDVDSGASSNTFDVEAQDLTVLSPSTVPELCKAAGYVGGGDLHPRAGIHFTFMLTGRPRVVAGRPMVLQDLVVVTDADGWLEVELVRNGVYDCVIEDQDDCVYRVRVPDRWSVSITDLIWPYLSELVYEEDDEPVTSVTVTIGEPLEIDAYVIFSSGVQTPFKLDGDKTSRDVGDYIAYTFSDEAPAIIEISEGVMTITGVVAGSTVLTATVRPDLEAERLPEPTRTLPTLTITVVE